MSTQKLGPVDVEFVLKNVNFKQEAGKMRAEISGISQTAKREVDETNKIMRTLGAGLGAYFSFQAIKGFGQELINVRGEFQQMGIALETMLGNKDKADRLMSQVVELSAKTPFSLTQVGQAAKQLLAYQVAQEDVIDTTTRLGNVAAGLSVPLDRLIMAYGQVKAKGKLMGDDLRQFTEAGIPMVSELANAFGVTQAEVYKLVETGKVGFEDVQQVIKNLTDEGGMFFNLMEKQSKSLTGMISNLGDAWDRMLNEIGTSNEGVLAGSIKGLTNLVENYEKVVDVIKIIAVTYGAYKAAVVASTIATNGLTIAENLHYAALVIAEKAQKLLNMTSLANPYVALATALTAVVGGLVIYSKWTNDISEKSKVLSEVTSDVNLQLENENSQLEVYKRRIEQTNPGSKERVRLVQELNEKYPDLLRNVDAENASVETLTSTFNSYIANLEKTIRLKTLESKLTDVINEKQNLESQYREKAISANERYEKSLKLDERRNVLIEELQYQKDLVEYGQKNADLLKEKRKLEEEIANIPTIANELRVKPQTFKEFKEMQLQLAKAAADAGRPFKQSLKDIEAAYNDYVKSLSDTNNDYDAKVNRIQEINKLLEKSEGSDNEKKLRTVDVIDAEIKKLKDDQQALSDTAKKWEEYQKRIDKLTKEREGITGTKKDEKVTGKVGVWEEKEALEKDLQDFATYQDRRLAIIEKYSKSRQRLQKEGYYDQAAEASEQMQKELDELDAAQFKKSESYRWVYDNIENMGQKALQNYIARLKKEIDAFKGNEEVKLELTKKLAEAEEKQKLFIPDRLRDSAAILTDMSEVAGVFNDELAESIKMAADLASNLANALAQFAAGNVVGGVVGIAATFAQVATKIVDDFKQGSESAKQAREDMLSFMQSYQLMLLTLKNEDYEDVFGVRAIEKASNAWAIAIEALEAYNKVINKSTQTDTIRNLLGSNVLKFDTDLENMRIKVKDYGKMAEAFGKNDKYKSLKDLAPQLWNDGVFDTEAAKLFLDTNKQLTKEQRAQIQNAIDLKERYDEAMAAVREEIESTYGSLGTEITDSLVNALENGANAWEDFYNAGADSLEGLGKKIAYELFFAGKFDQLQKQLEQTYKLTDAQQVATAQMNILENFFENINGDMQLAQEWMEEWQRQAKEAGFDLWTSGSESAGGLSGAISGMSQETADLMAGQLGAMRIHLADIASVVTGGFNSNLNINTTDLEYSFGLGLNAINNGITRSNEYLMQIEQNTRVINDIKALISKGILVREQNGFTDLFRDIRITGR